MEIAILLLACVACSMASIAIVAKDFDPNKPLEECRTDGDFLLHPTNRCKYIRCTYGPQQLKDHQGNFQFYGIEQHCPHGTAVSRAFYGHDDYGYNRYDGAHLAYNRLCTDRVSDNFGYRTGYDSNKCSVAAINRGYGQSGVFRGGYGPHVYGQQRYGNQGYDYNRNVDHRFVNTGYGDQQRGKGGYYFRTRYPTQ